MIGSFRPIAKPSFHTSFASPKSAIHCLHPCSSSVLYQGFEYIQTPSSCAHPWTPQSSFVYCLHNHVMTLLSLLRTELSARNSHYFLSCTCRSHISMLLHPSNPSLHSCSLLESYSYGSKGWIQGSAHSSASSIYTSPQCDSTVEQPDHRFALGD